ncbi:GLUG motif-containing protein [Parabacteroides sp. PF5-6]|uniref:GLUG motif-containing protein n=1 Tax=Parabacteroides sp. PF5-6 TaxID=1742403 RepID=UPI002406370A|nr:GLUG motif-containing protein [Parabacteroides sp. PF5-6]
MDGITDYIVNSAKGLAKLATLVNNSTDGLKDYTFTMTEDIDLTDLLADAETYPEGWVTIGKDFNHKFNGTFNGGNFKISGLKFTGSLMGLFGFIGEDGTVQNLHIETAKEGINGDMDIAGLAYCNEGIIEQCGVSGKITSSTTTGYAPGAAGLVYENNGSITYCYSTADITGTSTTGDPAYIGGLVCANYDEIENCYATGAVTITGTHNKNAAGGLLYGNAGTVINSYATGPLTAEGGMTGFIVKNYETTTNCYYNNEIKGYPEADDNATGLSEAEMKKAASFVEEWDFEDTWAIDEGSSYPYLAWAGKMETETPGVDTYYTITLDVAAGIELYNLSAGNHQVAEGDHLYLQFMPEDRTLGAADVLFLIDGVETAFTVLGENNYFSYILNPVSQDHTILIALREYPVTLPETEGILYNVGAGTHLVPYGETFTFSLTLADGIDPEGVHLFANGIEIQPDALRSVVLTYTIDKVITPITVVIEGTNPTSNGDIAKDDITLSIVNCQLSIVNSTGKPVDVAVYTIAGQNVVQLRALRDSKTIMLQPGIYLVKAGSEVYKVSVH